MPRRPCNFISHSTEDGAFLKLFWVTVTHFCSTLDLRWIFSPWELVSCHANTPWLTAHWCQPGLLQCAQSKWLLFSFGGRSHGTHWVSLLLGSWARMVAFPGDLAKDSLGLGDSQWACANGFLQNPAQFHASSSCPRHENGYSNKIHGEKLWKAKSTFH